MLFGEKFLESQKKIFAYSWSASLLKMYVARGEHSHCPPPPLLIPNDIDWRSKHMDMNNLPGVVTWQQPNHECNPPPYDLCFSDLFIYLLTYLLTGYIINTNIHRTWNSINRATNKRLQYAAPLYSAGRVTEKDTATISSVMKRKYRMPQKLMNISRPGIVFRFTAGANESCGFSRIFLVMTVILSLLNDILSVEKTCNENRMECNLFES